MIYLDNASSTKKKPFVVKYAIAKAVRKYLSNPGRSGHKYSIESLAKIYDTRCMIADMVNANPDEVIFTPSCTQALNLAIQGTAKRGGHIIASTFEHNSVLRTLESLKQTHNITYTIIRPNDKHTISQDEIENAIQDNTYLVIINHTSNVTGDTQDINAIGKICKKHNIYFLVDTAQSGGHTTVDMVADNISMLAISGHKGYLALQCGALVVKNNVNIHPIIFGGTGTKSMELTQPIDRPEGFEAGTLPVANIISLYYGMKYVKSHKTKIDNKITKMTKYLIDNLSGVDNITLYSKNIFSGVVSFNINSLDSTTTANILIKKYHLALRGGLHCAPMVHQHLGTTKSGAVRISLSYFNSMWQMKYAVHCIKQLANVYNKKIVV